jgi:membrane-associated phospholipid phosphatase
MWWGLGASLFVALLLLAFPFDRSVYLAVAVPQGGRAPVVEGLLSLFRQMGNGWFVAFLAGTILFLAPRRCGQALVLVLAVLLAFALGQLLLKPAIGKLRPNAELTPEDVERLVERGGSMTVTGGQARNDGSALFRPAFSGPHRDLTLPSGHTGLAFACLAVLARAFPRGRWWFLFLACGVGASRVLVGEHFLSDVIAGAGVGYACARLVLALPGTRRLMGGAG